MTSRRSFTRTAFKSEYGVHFSAAISHLRTPRNYGADAGLCDRADNIKWSAGKYVQRSVDLARRELSDDLLRTHVSRRAGDRSARIRAGAAVRDGGPVAERVEVRRGIRGELAIEERLSADEHRVV